MTGKIRFQFHGKPAVAVLDDMGVWRCGGFEEGKIIAHLLNVKFPPDPSPASGTFGRGALRRARKWLAERYGGEPTLIVPEYEPSPDGVDF